MVEQGLSVTNIQPRPSQVGRIHRKWEWDENGSGNWNYQQKMPDEGYHVNIQVKLCFFVGFLDCLTKTIKTL